MKPKRQETHLKNITKLPPPQKKRGTKRSPGVYYFENSFKISPNQKFYISAPHAVYPLTASRSGSGRKYRKRTRHLKLYIRGFEFSRGGGGCLTSEELHELLLVHAVEKALELRVPEVAEVKAGRHSTRSSRPPSNKRRS
jgi:hypothetical protein